MSNQTKHTPGPWKHCTGWVGAGPHTDPGMVPTIVICRVDGYPYGQTEANLDLIAAAPDLLAACKRAYTELDDRYDVDQEHDHSREIPFSGAGELMRMLQIAINNAEGR